MIRHRALDVGLRAQHDGRVVVDERLIARVLHADVVRDAPVVEDRPTELRSAERLEAASLEELGRVLGVERDRPDQRETRQQIGLGDADLRALRRQRPLDASHVGPPTQEVRRKADRDRRGRRRDRRGRLADELPDTLRRDAEQRRQRRRLLDDARFERGNLRLRRVQQRRRLRRVDVADRTLFRATHGDVVALALDLRVRLRDGNPLLRRTDADVVGGDLGEQRHEDVVVVGDGGQHLRVGRLDVAPEAAPQVELPRDVEARQELVEAQIGRRDERVLAGDDPSIAADGTLRLREERPDGDATPCLRFEDADAGGLQRRVLVPRLDDECGEGGIVERLPPASDRLRGRCDPVAIADHPLVGHRRRGTIVVGPDHHAARRQRPQQQDRREAEAADQRLGAVVRHVVVSGAGATRRRSRSLRNRSRCDIGVEVLGLAARNAIRGRMLGCYPDSIDHVARSSCHLAPRLRVARPASPRVERRSVVRDGTRWASSPSTGGTRA